MFNTKKVMRNILSDKVSKNKRIRRKTKKISEMNTSQIRQIYGDYVGNDVSDAMLRKLERQDMVEVLFGMGYEK